MSACDVGYYKGKKSKEVLANPNPNISSDKLNATQ